MFFGCEFVTPVKGITWRAVMKKMAEITKGLVGQPMFKLLRIAGEMEKAGCRILQFEIGDSDCKAVWEGSDRDWC